MASLIIGDADIEDLNKAIGYLSETIKHCRTDRREKLSELMDSLLDEKLDQQSRNAQRQSLACV